MADVPHIVFAVADPNAALPQSVLEVPYLKRHIATYRGGVRAAEALATITRHSPELAEALGGADGLVVDRFPTDSGLT
jgi:hypothetical protein